MKKTIKKNKRTTYIPVHEFSSSDDSDEYPPHHRRQPHPLDPDY